MDSSNVSVVLGMIVHNDAAFLRTALDSLITQTYINFALYISDDASTDASWDIIQSFASKDSRIVPLRQSRRQGMIANYNHIFARVPSDTAYFSWVAGHDLYASNWLEILVKHLEQNAGLVLAYPLTERIDGENKVLPVASELFSATQAQPSERFAALETACGFGNMIYGLFRWKVLKQIGPMPQVLLPDRMFIWEVALFGGIEQVLRPLWQRRFYATPSEQLFAQTVLLQRKKLWARRPLQAYLPFAITHVLALFWRRVLSPFAGSLRLRRAGLLLSLRYWQSNKAWITKDPSWQAIIPW